MKRIKACIDPNNNSNLIGEIEAWEIDSGKVYPEYGEALRMNIKFYSDTFRYISEILQDLLNTVGVSSHHTDYLKETISKASRRSRRAIRDYLNYLKKMR